MSYRKKEVKEWLGEIYHGNLEVYDYKTYIKLTNGSVSFDIRIFPNHHGEILITGLLRGKRVRAKCSYGRDEFEETLSEII